MTTERGQLGLDVDAHAECYRPQPGGDVLTDIERMRLGTRVMCMSGADRNLDLTDPHENDGHIYIGAALSRPDQPLPSGRHETMWALVRRAGLRFHNTFNKVWNGVYTDDYSDIDDEARMRATTTLPRVIDETARITRQDARAKTTTDMPRQDARRVTEATTRFAALRQPHTRMRVDCPVSTPNDGMETTADGMPHQGRNNGPTTPPPANTPAPTATHRTRWIDAIGRLATPTHDDNASQRTDANNATTGTNRIPPAPTHRMAYHTNERAATRQRRGRPEARGHNANNHKAQRYDG